MHNETKWTPENYPPDERTALEEALQIQREAEIIQMTGWTFLQYDLADAGRLNRMLAYIQIKNAIEAEKAELDSKRHGGLTGR